MLMQIHNEAAVSYIGCSKLSCLFCAVLFEAYRNVTKRKIKTRGTYGQTSKWQFPRLPDNIETQVREAFCSLLKSKITAGWDELPGASIYSQSSDASGQEREQPVTSMLMFPSIHNVTLNEYV